MVGQRRHRRRQPGHDPGRHPVLAFPHPRARRDQHDQQRPAAQPVAQSYEGAVLSRDPHVGDGRPGRRADGHLAGEALGRQRRAGVRPRRAQRPASEVTVRQQRVVATGRAGDVGAQSAAATEQGKHLVGGAQPRGDRRPPFRLVAVEQRLAGAVVPDQGQFPGEVVGVQQPLLQALGAERSQQMGRVPGEQHAAHPPAAREPVVDRVDAGVEELVDRRRAVGPAGEGLADPVHEEFRCDQVLAGRQQPVQAPHTVRQRAADHLAGRRPRRPPRRHAVEQRLVGPREFGAQGGYGVSFHRRTAGEADVLEFADGGAGAVAADQVTAAPPGAGGATGVGRDTGLLLLDAVQPAVHGDLDQPFTGERRAQDTGQLVLGDVQGSRFRVAEHDLACHLLAPHRPPSGPTRPQPRQRCAGQPLDERDGLLAQDDGARGARFVLARALVEDDTGHLLPRQRQGEREPDGPRSGDDHRVHGATPPARGGVPGDMGEQDIGAGCTVTERMQPIAAACVKRRRPWRSCHGLR